MSISPDQEHVTSISMTSENNALHSLYIEQGPSHRVQRTPNNQTAALIRYYGTLNGPSTRIFYRFSTHYYYFFIFLLKKKDQLLMILLAKFDSLEKPLTILPILGSSNRHDKL